MKIAIVGSSHLTDEEKDKAWKVVGDQIDKYESQDYEIVTGDADGIDWLVRQYAIEPKVFYSKDKNEKEFKIRNKQIADYSDYVISITTRTKNKKCYHCDEDHQRTGGCWTYKMARQQGKKGEVIIL